MKQKFTDGVVIILIAALVSSCGSSKKIAYLQGTESMAPSDFLTQSELYNARIMPKDLLTIIVSTTDPEASRPFNLVTPTLANGTTVNFSTASGQLQTYLVDNNGGVELPVIGEVGRPNTFTIQNEKVNLFEALAMAGDMTIWGRRDNVKILREEADGSKRVITMNMNDPNVIFHPDFYLRQNDVVYVEPNKVKAQSSEISSATGLWLSATSIVISMATLLLNGRL